VQVSPGQKGMEVMSKRTVDQTDKLLTDTETQLKCRELMDHSLDLASV